MGVAGCLEIIFRRFRINNFQKLSAICLERVQVLRKFWSTKSKGFKAHIADPILHYIDGIFFPQFYLSLL